MNYTVACRVPFASNGDKPEEHGGRKPGRPQPNAEAQLLHEELDMTITELHALPGGRGNAASATSSAGSPRSSPRTWPA